MILHLLNRTLSLQMKKGQVFVVSLPGTRHSFHRPFNGGHSLNDRFRFPFRLLHLTGYTLELFTYQEKMAEKGFKWTQRCCSVCDVCDINLEKVFLCKLSPSPSESLQRPSKSSGDLVAQLFPNQLRKQKNILWAGEQFAYRFLKKPQLTCQSSNRTWTDFSDPYGPFQAWTLAPMWFRRSRTVCRDSRNSTLIPSYLAVTLTLVNLMSHWSALGFHAGLNFFK